LFQFEKIGKLANPELLEESFHDWTGAQL